MGTKMGGQCYRGSFPAPTEDGGGHNPGLEERWVRINASKAFSDRNCERKISGSEQSLDACVLSIKAEEGRISGCRSQCAGTTGSRVLRHRLR